MTEVTIRRCGWRIKPLSLNNVGISGDPVLIGLRAEEVSARDRHEDQCNDRTSDYCAAPIAMSDATDNHPESQRGEEQVQGEAEDHFKRSKHSIVSFFKCEELTSNKHITTACGYIQHSHKKKRPYTGLCLKEQRARKPPVPGCGECDNISEKNVVFQTLETPPDGCCLDLVSSLFSLSIAFRGCKSKVKRGVSSAGGWEPV